MKSYRYLSHTADVRLKLKAGSLNELFESALEGMNNILKEGLHLKPSIKETFEIKSVSTTALLVDFLNEVLTLSNLNKVIFNKLEIEKINDREISGSLCGVPVNYFDEDIKAVTYHEAEVIKNEQDEFETVLIFDI
jgi:SHS2 domain-containing protein